MSRRTRRAALSVPLTAALLAGLLAGSTSPAQAVAGPVAWEESDVLTGRAFSPESGLQQDVAVLPDGRVAVSYVLVEGVDGDLYDRPLRVYLRDLDGTWSLDAQLTASFITDGVATIETPELHATADGRLLTAIHVPDNAWGSVSVRDGILAKVRSADGVWTTAVMEEDTVATDDCGMLQEARVGSSGSRLMVAWTCTTYDAQNNPIGKTAHARVHDGVSWSAIETLSTATSVVPDGIVALPDGAFAVLARLPGDTDPVTVDSKVAVLVRSAAGQWTETVLPQSQQAWDIVSHADGSLLVTWLDTAHKASRRSAEGVWGAAEDYDGALSGTQSVLSALPDGRAVAAWAGPLSVHASVRAVDGTWGAPTTLSATKGTGVRIATDDEGNTAVAWIASNPLVPSTIPTVRSSTLPAGSATWSSSAQLATVSVAGVGVELAADGLTFAAAWYTGGSTASYFDLRAAVGAGGEETGPPPPPATTSPTTTSGTFRVGQVVTCTSPTWVPGPVTLAYQWLRSGAPLTGATAAKRTLGLYDLGKTVACRVTATNAGGSTSSTSTAKTVYKGFAPVATVKPSISGTLKVGRTLTCARGTWSPTFSYTYKRQWYRGTTKITGAIYSTYTVKLVDRGKRLMCRVTAARTGYNTGAANSASKLIG